MTPEQGMVDEFHEAFALQRPSKLDIENLNGELRVRLMQEELDEFKQAWAARDVEGMVDALVDLLYVTHGSAVSLGVDLEPHFREVHSANMRKLGQDGKPIYRQDGKLLKPEGWVGPDHAPILAAQRSAYTGRSK